MANKDLFKQAIADAKSIREAAITNAKLALEESLTPQLKELLAQRLAEMEEEAETETVLAEAEVEETETMEEGDYKEEVAEAEEAEEKEEEGEEAGEEEAEDDSEKSEDEAEDEEIEDMTVEDLKDLIRDILSQEMDDMEAPEGEEGDEEAEDMVGMDMTAEPEAEAGEEEINLDELMAELAEMAKTDEETVEETINDPETETAHGNVAEEDMEEGNLNETPDLLQIGAGLAALFAAAGGVAAVQSAAEAGKLGSAMKSIMGKITSTANTMGTNKAGSSNSIIREEELAEAIETIETLRKDLNEVNLLNAKLLYVNKVFKANALTESQKATVIAAFDKAETVKEVKLVFETVSENIPSGKKEVVKEAKGFASAAVGKSDKPGVIAETNQAVLRMQKLAGIIK
jgi:hypothetical protein